VAIAKQKAQAAAALAMKKIASTSHTIPQKQHQTEQEHTNEDRKKRGDTTQEENVDKLEKGKKTVHWEKSIETKAKEYAEDEKKLWIYISNVELEGGEQGWKPQHDSW
jgi:type IV secretory pathway VirB9-like protein